MDGKEYLEGLRAYILKLTGQDIKGISSIKLSSAQKARVADWHTQNNYDIPDLTNTCFWKADNSSTSENKLEEVNQDFGIIDRRIRVGIDIQLISEFLPDITEINKSSNELSTIFTKKELSYCETKQDPRETATGIFALKEAILKASSKDYKSLKDIEIILQEQSPPKHEEYILSLSHSGDMVSALAIQLRVPSDNFAFEQDKLDNNSSIRLIWRILVSIGAIGGLTSIILLIKDFF